MKIYLAGIFSSNFDKHGRVYSLLTDAERYHRDRVQYILESYHYIHRQTITDKIRRDQTQIFLDSGAFSAFTKGVDVDLRAYCNFIHANDDLIVREEGVRCASVLDAIGDPLKTWENQQAMERMGATPLPCYHYGEDERYLEYYAANYDYITIGGMVPISNKQLLYWLDRIWDRYLVDGAGRPKLKVHGFGLTTLSLIEDYPWFSVDSSSWVMAAANGFIRVPNLGSFFISNNSATRKVEGYHFNNISRAHQEAIANSIEANGFEIERIQNEYITRWSYNCYSFTEINRQINADPTIGTLRSKQIGLF